MPAVKSYRSEKIQVSETTIAGRGVVAIEDIRKGEIVAIKAGHIVTTEEVLAITREIGDYSLQIHDDFFLTPRTKDEIDDLTIFINHSCDANVGFRGQVVYVAIRDIAAGEELCHDYAMARTAPYSMDCHCGAHDCRSTVTGNDWKLPALQNKYGQYFHTYILEKITGNS